MPGTGIFSQLGMATETTQGVAQTVTRFYEFNSESMAGTKTTVQGAGLHAGGLVPRLSRRALTTRDVSGGFNLNVPNKGLGMLAQHMMGSFTNAPTLVAGTSSAYQQIHPLGTIDGKSFTLQKGVPQTNVAGTINPITYVGCKISTWTVSVATGGIATLALTVDARQELSLNSTPAGPALATASYAVTAGEFNFVNGTLLTGGTPTTTAGLVTVAGATTLASVTGASVTLTRQLKEDRYFLGSAGIKDQQVENGLAVPTGTIDAEFFNKADIYDLFASDAALTLQLNFVQAAGTAGTGTGQPSLSIIVPGIHFDGSAPQVGGPDIITLSAPWSGGDDGVNTPMQLVYVSSDIAV